MIRPISLMRFGLLAYAASAADFLPLATRNSQTYRETRCGRTFAITVAEAAR